MNFKHPVITKSIIHNRQFVYASKPMNRSNTQIAVLSFKEATALSVRFVKVFSKEIMTLLFVQILLDQIVEKLTGQFKSGANQSISLISMILFLSMFSEFFLNNAFLLLAAKTTRERDTLKPIELNITDLQDFQQMIKEELRFFGEVLMGFLLFLFPGFNRLVDYSWVPFVVLFEEDYRRGSIDALKTSKLIARKHFWFISSVLTLTSLCGVGTNYLITGGEGSIFVNRLPVLIAAVIGVLLNLYFKLFYCALYRHSRDRTQNLMPQSAA